MQKRVVFVGSLTDAQRSRPASSACLTSSVSRLWITACEGAVIPTLRPAAVSAKNGLRRRVCLSGAGWPLDRQVGILQPEYQS